MGSISLFSGEVKIVYYFIFFVKGWWVFWLEFFFGGEIEFCLIEVGCLCFIEDIIEKINENIRLFNFIVVEDLGKW